MSYKERSYTVEPFSCREHERDIWLGDHNISYSLDCTLIIEYIDMGTYYRTNPKSIYIDGKKYKIKKLEDDYKYDWLDEPEMKLTLSEEDTKEVLRRLDEVEREHIQE